MKGIKIGLLVMVGTLLPSLSHGMADRLSGMTQYVPSWQTVRASLPPAAYWPGITASTVALLGLNPFNIMGTGAVRNLYTKYVLNPYISPIMNTYYKDVAQRFMAENNLQPGYLRQHPEMLPDVEKKVASYLLADPHLNNVAARLIPYYIGVPAALLLGGHLYHTYR